MNVPELDDNGEKIVDEKTASTSTLVEAINIPPPKAPPLPGTQGAPVKKIYKQKSDPREQSDASSTSSTDTTSSGSAREHAKILENVLAKGACGPPERKPFTYTPHLEELKAASKRWKRFKDAECVATSKNPLQPELIPELSNPVTCYPDTEAPKNFPRQYQSPSLMNIDRWTGSSDSSMMPQRAGGPMITSPAHDSRNLYYDTEDKPAHFKMAPEIRSTHIYNSIPYAVQRHDRVNHGFSNPVEVAGKGQTNSERKETSPPIPINIKVVKKPNPNETTNAVKNVLGPRVNQGSSYLVPFDRAIPVEIVNEITSPLPNATHHVSSHPIPHTPVTANGIIKGAKSCSSLLNENTNGRNEPYNNYYNNLANYDSQNRDGDKWKSYRGPTEVDPDFRHAVYREMEARPWGKDYNITKHIITPARSTDYLDADVRRYFGHNPNIIPQQVWITKEFYANSKEGQLPESYSSPMSARDWVEMRGTTDF